MGVTIVTIYIIARNNINFLFILVLFVILIEALIYI